MALASITRPLISPLTVNLPKMHSHLRKRLAERFHTPDVPKKAVLLFQGGEDDVRYNTDNEKLFRQESNFHYLFGVNEAGFYGAIHVHDGHSVLFMPRLPAEYAVWMGKIRSPDEVKAVYGVDDVLYVDELHKYFTQLDPDVIYTLRGKNTDSGSLLPPAHFDGMDNFRVDHGKLWAEMCECRIIKTEEEIEVMRYVNKISSWAHLEVMKATRAGMYEYELESLFYHLCYSLFGCRYFAYTPICASGPNSAILHYGHAGCPNDRVLEEKDMVLLDMGVEYHCYASDITRAYPVSGKFTTEQRDIWETVMAAKTACFAVIRPSVKWDTVHRTAERTIVTSLAAKGYLVGNVEEMLEKHVAALFMPHGIGHLLGLDTHDIGGYPRGTARIQLPGLNKLRTTRVLQPGMVLTVEPGCYFISSLLLPAFSDPKYSPFLVEEKLRPLLSFGGVRIEDNIVIRDDGFENLSTGPLSSHEIEEIMASRK